MPVENRNLSPGTTLVATYRKQDYTCTVEDGENGKSAYVLADGRRFTSPSAAASAITNSSQNGWRWWSVAGTQRTRAPKQPNSAKADAGKGSTHKQRKAAPLIKRLKQQTGTPDGLVAYFCSACMDGFTAPEGEIPTACPKGHTEQPVA